jgi:hypothetical protein
MSDHWEFFPCNMDGRDAFIFVDVGIAEAIHEAPSTLIRVRLTFRSVHPTGLPTEEDMEPANAIEDRLEEFALSVDDWYVGRITTDGFRDFYVYSTQSPIDWANLITTLNEESGYMLKLSALDDPKHECYFQYLYPADEDWRVIGDLRVIQQVAEAGDDGQEARPINHWTYFDNEADAAPFIAWAESADFLLLPGSAPTEESDEYCVRLQHEGTLALDDITSRTIELVRKAAEFGGRYDGWETPVVKTEDSVAE